jgi:hypothetical protein
MTIINAYNSVYQFSEINFSKLFKFLKFFRFQKFQIFFKNFLKVSQIFSKVLEKFDQKREKSIKKGVFSLKKRNNGTKTVKRD